MNKRIEELLLEIQSVRYEMNEDKAKELTYYHIEKKMELEKELFFLLRNVTDNMTQDEVRVYVAKNITPYIIKTSEDLGEYEQKFVKDRLEESYVAQYNEVGNLIRSGLDEPIHYRFIRPEMVERAVNNKIDGKLFSERIWTNKNKLADRLHKDVYAAISEGVDIRRLSTNLARDFNTSISDSMRLLQNETTRVINQAQEDIYEQSDVVEETMFTATLDDRTTDICQELDGTRHEKGEDKPSIPEDTHIGCRSTYIPIVKGWSPTIRHDNLEKKTIDYVDYRNWK